MRRAFLGGEEGRHSSQREQLDFRASRPGGWDWWEGDREVVRGEAEKLVGIRLFAGGCSRRPGSRCKEQAE